MSEESGQTYRAILPGKGVLIFDGAMGTMLACHPHAIPCESLNLSSPESVIEVHRAYVRAGADVIRTNTFGANRINLGICGLAHKTAAINGRAVELARVVAQEASGSRTVLVAGSIGPIHRHVLSGSDETGDRASAYSQHARALVDAGVDMLICETFQDCSEIEVVLDAVLPVAQSEKQRIPFALCITPRADSGQAADFAVTLFDTHLRHRGVDMFGLNCGYGPESVVRPLPEISKLSAIPLLALPSAGLPIAEGKTLRYPVGVDQFCEQLITLVEAGLVRGIGGCCGTTPDYIAALARSVKALASN